MNDEDKVICPQCGSTQAHAEKRGWKWMTGFIGSSAIVITCLKCAHQFKPGQGRGGLQLPQWFIEGTTLNGASKTHRLEAANADDAAAQAMALDMASVDRVWPVGTKRPA